MLLLVACGSGDAAPFTWDASGSSPLDDGAGNWNATGGTNWFNGTTYGAWGNTNADTAAFGVNNGTAGTITVGSVTANGITFNTAGSGNYTLSSGTITMAGTTPTITVNASGTTTLTSVLAGSAGLTKTGAGTLLLGTGNTYTGTTTITQGFVRVSSQSGAVSSAVVLNGGGIDVSGFSSAPTWAITVGTGGGTVVNSSGSEWGFATGQFRGSGTVTLRGPNNFNLTNNQGSFSGKWVIDGVMINYGDGLRWGSATGDDVITLVNGGWLFGRGQPGTVGSTTQGIYVGTGGGSIQAAAGGATVTNVNGKISGISSGNVGFGVAGGSSVVLNSTSNSYEGNTRIFGNSGAIGYVRLGASEVIPDGAGKGNVFIFNAGGPAGLNLNGFSETINGLSSFNGSTFATDSIVDNRLASSTSTLTVGNNDASATFSGAIQNTGASATLGLTKVGTGTQTLSGANTYSGTTSINAGTLQIGAGSTAGALATSSVITGSAGATLAFNRSNTLTQGTNFNSVIGGAINVSQLGSGTLVLNGENTFSGTTRPVAGTLSLNSANALQNSTLDLNSADAGSVLFGLTGTNTYNIGSLIGSRNLATSGSVVLSVGGNGASGAYTGVISGGGAFTKVGAGTLTLSAANTYTGTTSVNAGTLQIGSNGTTGGLASTSVISGSAGATLAFSRTDNYGGNFSNAIGGGLGVTLNSGTLTLSAANTYTGTTTVNAGILALGTNGVISNQSNLLINGGGFNLAGFSDTVGAVTLTSGSIFGAGTLTGSSYALQGGTLASILGSGPIAVSTGTTTLGSASRFNSASGLTISSGQLTLGGSESVASFVLSGGVLAGTGNTLTSAAAYDVQAGSVSANLGGSVGLTKSTAGTVTLLGANGFSGNTTISGGTLALGLNGSFNSSPTITVGSVGSSGAVLDLTAKTGGFTFGLGQTVKGIGTIEMAAGQALTLNGTLAAGNSPGTLTIAGGDLVLGGSSVTQYEISGTDNTVGGGINDLTRVAGSLTLGGTLSVTATPAFDLFGSRTYRVFDYATGGSGSLAGSMTVGATPDANYLYSLNTATLGQVNLFVQRKAEQSAALAYSQPTSGTVSAFTNTNVSFSGTLANLSPAGGAGLTVSLAGNGGQLTVGSLAAASGSSVAAGSSAAVTGQIATGTALGARTWNVVNTDSGAIGSQTSTANGVVNVFAHGTPTLSGTTIDFGYVLVGTSTSRSLTVSNGTLGLPVSNTGGITWTSGTLPGGFTGGGASSAGVIASGSGATYSFTLATGSAGGPGGSQTFSFADDSSILGSGFLGTQSVSLTGTVLDPATAILSGGITSGTTWLINLGEHNQGAGVYTQGFSISNLLQTLGYTADLELLSFASDPANTGDIGITLSGTSFGTLAPGLPNSYQASLSLAATGGFANVYNLSFGSSKNGSSLGGAPQNVQLTVTGVIIVPEPGAVALAGVGIALSVWVARRRRP